ncbi:MAG: DUF4124 domain-containing protein [Gammaproteobacteria bacterium]
MKKLFIKLMIVVVVMLTVPYYFLGGSLKMPGFLQGVFSGSGSGSNNEPMTATSVRTDRDVTVYKWVDKNGSIHFSEKPPVGEVAEVLELKTDTNVMQAVKVPEPEQEEEQDVFGGKIISLGKSPNAISDAKDEEMGETSEGGLENPYSPDGVQKLIENAKNVSKMMDQRQKQQQAVFGGASGE